jgi:uncharacterized protein YjbJ (UPF0337 family)
MRVQGDPHAGSLHGHPQFAVTTTEGIHPMGIVDKAKNAAQDVAGTAKEHVGKVTGDHHTEGEGKKDQAVSSVKKAGENIKDAFKK